MASFATAAGLAYDPKSWVAGVWTIKKSGNGRSAPAGISRNNEVAIFATQLDRLMTEELAVRVWTKKSDGTR